MFKTIVVYLTFISLFSFVFLQYAEATSSNVSYDLDDTVYGKSYPYWASQWWQWHISLPSSEHPRENYTPERCSLSQQGPVWFLADGPSKSNENRVCEIPGDKSIIVQVIGGECDYGEIHLKNDADIITCVDRGIDDSTVRAFLDGIEIADFQDKRIGHYWFNITVPADNIYEEAAGTYRALVDGWFLFLKPLSPGQHELILQGDHYSYGPDGIPTEEDHHQNIRYQLLVQ